MKEIRLVSPVENTGFTPVGLAASLSKTLFVPYPTLVIRPHAGEASIADRSIYLLAVFMLICAVNS